MKNLSLLLIITLAVTACQPEHRIFSEHQALSPDVEWLKKDTRTFDIPIEDNSLTYDLSVTFRYATGYPFQTANISVTEVSPSGEKTIKEYAITVREANGEYIGEPGYDIWDSTHLIEPNKTYTESGTYSYTIAQISPADPLNFAMEIGMILDKKVD